MIQQGEMFCHACTISLLSLVSLPGASSSNEHEIPLSHARQQHSFYCSLPPEEWATAWYMLLHILHGLWDGIMGGGHA